jgi:hypothetical protein
MKISDVIAQLEQIKSEHGDLKMCRYSFGAISINASPTIEHLKILNKRESKQRTWNTWDGEEKKGEKVCII